MKKLLPLFLLAACTDTDPATQQESLQIWAAAQTAMTNAQSKALDQAGMQLTAPLEITLDYTGPCTLGGKVSVSGSVSRDDSGDETAIDLKSSFSDCAEATGTLDGRLEMTQVRNAQGLAMTMTGGIDWKGQDGEASCDFDLSMSITESQISYTGHLCGYDVRTELKLGGN